MFRCLDWGGPHTLISAAYAHSLSTSPLVKNDIFVTDIRTGFYLFILFFLIHFYGSPCIVSDKSR